MLNHLPTATSALTNGLPSEATPNILLTILTSALNLSSSSHSSSPPTLLHESNPTSRMVPSAKTAEALTCETINYMIKFI